jgi:methionyl aminopeptidase
VHGIPDNTSIKEGDLVTVDIGVMYNSCCTDAARTFFVGDTTLMSDSVSKMLSTCNTALDAGISKAVTGNCVGDISYSIQKEIEFNGLRSPYQLGGHGLSSVPHEEPFIPNYGLYGTGDLLCKGQKLAIEPIVVYSPEKVTLSDDGWLWYCSDYSLSAHKEDTVVVWDGAPIVLTRETFEGDLI